MQQIEAYFGIVRLQNHLHFHFQPQRSQNHMLVEDEVAHFADYDGALSVGEKQD